MSSADEAKKRVAEALKSIRDLDYISGVNPLDVDEWIQATRSFINVLGGYWDPDKMDYSFQSGPSDICSIHQDPDIGCRICYP